MAEAEQKPADGGQPNQDAEYWKGEAKRAFEKREELKKQLAAFEGVDPVRAKDAMAKLEEFEQDRLKRAGEFEAARKAIEDKARGELEAVKRTAAALEQQLAADKIDLAFQGASALFGPAGETVLDADIAAAYFRGHVAYETVEIAGKELRTVVVKDATGNIVRGADGNPAPFTEAMRQVIASLPKEKQDRILRGSGKTGSGSSGGSTVQVTDSTLADITSRARAGDKAAVAALKARKAEMGGMVEGSAWEK